MRVQGVRGGWVGAAISPKSPSCAEISKQSFRPFYLPYRRRDTFPFIFSCDFSLRSFSTRLTRHETVSFYPCHPFRETALRLCGGSTSCRVVPLNATRDISEKCHCIFFGSEHLCRKKRSNILCETLNWIGTIKWSRLILFIDEKPSFIGCQLRDD